MVIIDNITVYFTMTPIRRSKTVFFCCAGHDDVCKWQQLWGPLLNSGMLII